MSLHRRVALPALAIFALAPLAASAGAQAAAAKCEIDETKPNQVKDARNAIVKAGLLGKPEERRKETVKAIQLLTTNPERINNPAGRNLVLGRALVVLASEPEAQTVVPRGSIGYATQPEATIDLLAAADTAFDAVEASNPACASETEQYRRAAYAPLANAAIAAFNAQQVDSARTLAERATLIAPNSPIATYAYLVLGNVHLTKEDLPNAIQAFTRVAEVSKGDTSVASERKDALLRVPDLMVTQAEKLEGDAKKQLLTQAAQRYEEFIKEYPDEPQANLELARVYSASGENDKATRIYADILTNKDKYTAIQLFRAGEAAARAERAKEASQFFEAGLVKNPYFRDGLFNLAVTYAGSEQLDKMLPVLERLMQVDPSNPENYRLYVQYYRDKANVAKTAAAKKPATSPEAKAFAALNDSLLKYFKLFQEAPVKVTVTTFRHDDTKHTLGGSVENLTDAEKSYDLKLEFLDASGNVVTTATTKVEGVAAKTSKPFRVTAEGAGVVAYRYAPVGS